MATYRLGDNGALRWPSRASSREMVRRIVLGLPESALLLRLADACVNDLRKTSVSDRSNDGLVTPEPLLEPAPRMLTGLTVSSA